MKSLKAQLVVKHHRNMKNNLLRVLEAMLFQIKKALVFNSEVTAGLLSYQLLSLQETKLHCTNYENSSDAFYTTDWKLRGTCSKFFIWMIHTLLIWIFCQVGKKTLCCALMVMRDITMEMWKAFAFSTWLCSYNENKKYNISNEC